MIGRRVTKGYMLTDIVLCAIFVKGLSLEKNMTVPDVFLHARTALLHM